MTTTITSQELEAVSLTHDVARLIRDNTIYQHDGKNDPWLCKEMEGKGYNLCKHGDTIRRTARKIRERRRKYS